VTLARQLRGQSVITRLRLMRSDVVIYIGLLTELIEVVQLTQHCTGHTYINSLRELLITSRQQLATKPARNHNELD